MEGFIFCTADLSLYGFHPCFLCSGLPGSAAVSLVMASTSWPVQLDSMPSTSGKRALETW